MAAPGISPYDLTVGQLVDIEARTWSFINKPGGTAKITHIHYDADHVARSVDVMYSLGGRETNLELTYVKMYVEVARNSRSRKRDVKMNVDTLGGQQRVPSSEGTVISNACEPEKKTKNKGMEEGGSAKKKKKRERIALASIDKNQPQIANTSRGAHVESLERASETVGAKLSLLRQVGMPSIETKKAMNEIAPKYIDLNEETIGSKAKKCGGYESTTSLKARKSSDQTNEANRNGELIQDGKISDYINILQKDRRISYWWSEEDGWLMGNIVKGLKKIVTTSTIKWTITVAFDNGDKHTLTFHPLDKRWKIFKPTVKASEELRKEIVNDHPASTKSTKKSESSSVGGKKNVVSTKSVGGESVDEKKCTLIKKSKVVNKDKQAGKLSSNSSKSSSTSKPKGYKQLSLSFGLHAQSQKAKEVSSNIHTPKNAFAAKKTDANVSELSLSTKCSSERSSLLPDNTLKHDVANDAPHQNQSMTFALSKTKGQSVDSMGKETSLEIGVASRNSFAEKPVSERGHCKLPPKEAKADQDEEQRELQAENDRNDITTKRKTNPSISQNNTKKMKVESVEKLAEVVDADGKWELVKDGKITDYTNNLQNGQRISYWWSDTDGWLKGTIYKGLKRIVTTSTIKWTITVVFDNGDKHTLPFHPQDKRWKMFHPQNVRSSLITDRLKKPSVSEKINPVPLDINNPVGHQDAHHAEVSNKESNANRKLTDADKKLVKSNEKFSTSESKRYKQLPLSFGFQLQSKVQEVTSKIHTSSATNNKVMNAPVAGSCFPAVESGFHAPLPPKPRTNDVTETKTSVDVREESVARALTLHVSNSSPPSKRNNSKYSIKSSISLTRPSQTVLQTLYKKECGKATEFVDYMTAPTEIKSISSPGVLELILDQKREDQFNSLLSEIMYNERLDMMDVDELIERMNKRQECCMPFSLLEVKPLLQKLHRDNRIFLVEEEGRNGVVYAI